MTRAGPKCHEEVLLEVLSRLRRARMIEYWWLRRRANDGWTLSTQPTKAWQYKTHSIDAVIRNALQGARAEAERNKKR